MMQDTDFQKSQQACSEQFQKVLEARLQYAKAVREHREAQRLEVLARNNETRATKECVREQAALDKLLKPGES